MLTTIPFVFPQWFDSNGDPAAGYKLFTYEAGTTTKLETFTDSTGTVAHSNPIILNSAGRPPSLIFLQALSYKFVMAPPGDSDPPTSPIWTADNVAANSAFDDSLDIIGVAGEPLVAGDCVYLSGGDGGRTAGRWYKTDADLDYASTTARVIGFSVTDDVDDSAILVIRRGGRLTGLAGLTAGALYYVSATAGAITSTAPTNPRRVAQADATTSIVIAAEIVEPLKGYIPIDLTVWREIITNEIGNGAANGGLLSSDTTPALVRVNLATDKALRINWIGGNSDEITACISYPPDLDDAAVMTFKFIAASAGATNSPVIAVNFFEGVGDTNAGTNSAAVTGTTPTEYSITIAAADVGTHPNFASFSLIPAAHATDALRIYATYVEYTRKLKST